MSTAPPRPRCRCSRAPSRSISSTRASAATASARARWKHPRCCNAQPRPGRTERRSSSPGRRWAGSALPRKSRPWPSISPATKPPSPPASTSSSMAATCSDSHPTRGFFTMGKNKIDLNGRTAVVTGGAQGFGRAITERFVESGAKVAIWDFDQALAEKTAKEIGNAVSAFKVDVGDLAAVEQTRDATVKAFGKIDILVNNAGIAGVNKTVWETDLDEWRKVLRINLDGPFICCKAIVPAMVRQNYGRIV